MYSAMLALTILRETAAKLFGNWGAALRISALPLLLPSVLLAIWLLWAINTGAIVAYIPRASGGGGEIPVLPIILFLVVAFGTYPVAVKWHRFELLNEQPAWLEAKFHAGTSFGYFGRTILLMLWVALCMFVLMLPMFALADKVGGSFNFSMGEVPVPPTTKNFILSCIIFALVNAAFFRFAMILPARAFGLNMTFRESKDGLQKTGFKTLLWIGLFFHLAPIATNLLIGGVRLGDVSSILLLPFLFLFWLMFGIAVLTRLYDRSGLPVQAKSFPPTEADYPLGPPPPPVT